MSPLNNRFEYILVFSDPRTQTYRRTDRLIRAEEKIELKQQLVRKKKKKKRKKKVESKVDVPEKDAGRRKARERQRNDIIG